MAVVIPPFPAGTSTTLTFRSSAVDQTPYLGGPVQRVARLGDRWTYSVDLRPMGAAQARPLVTAIRQGLSAKVLCPVILAGIDLSQQIDLTAQSGSGKSLNVLGDTSHIGVGQVFSLVSNGVRYLHEVTSIAGQVVGINPALKVVIAGGEALEFAEPKIEGFLEGNEHSMTIGMVGNLGTSFKINEAQ